MFEAIDSVLKAFNALVGECDKRRLIDYGAKKVETKNYEHLNKLLAAGINVRRQSERRGDDTDDYRRG